MSQVASTNPFVLDPSLPPVLPDLQEPLPEHFSVGNAVLDDRADEVMNDLFGGVERLLQEGGSLPPEEPAFLEPELPAFHFPVLEVPGLVPQSAAPLDSLPAPEPPAEEESLDQLDLVLQHSLPEPLPTVAPAPTPTRSHHLFDRLLLVLAGAALLGTGAVWFLLQTRLQSGNFAPTGSAVPAQMAANPGSGADPEFAKYMERSLDMIDRKAEVARQTETIARNPDGELPRVAVAPPSSAPPSRTSRVLERVYVPVYQPPSAFNVPTVPLQPTTPAPVSVASQPRTVQPSAPSAIAPSAPAAAPAPATTTAILPPNIASTEYALVGVLELGDRSAALFEVNGTPRRIQVGEPIGNSGWTLVTIRNQEAIVRRNGEVRSIYVGQRF